MATNLATERGGAIYVKDDSILTITEISDFVENWANDSGGAPYADTSSLKLGGVNSFSTHTRRGNIC